MIEERLKLASSYELYSGKDSTCLDDLVNKRDVVRWARTEEERPLMPDTIEYIHKPFISLSALIP